MSEARMHQECVIWFHNTYPELRGLLCYNNNNSHGGRSGAINKTMGVVPGRSDLVLYYSGRANMIELKTLKGKQSPKQKAWAELVNQQGFPYYLIRSLNDFKLLCIFILKR